MKVMQINCVYNTGSTGKIVWDIHTNLANKGYESVICYGRGKKVLKDGVYKTSSELFAKFNNVKSRFTGMPYRGSFFATNKLISIIKKENPDVVHIHCINGFFVNIYRLVKFLKVNNFPTVITHHAEFLYTGNCSHAFECEKWKSGCGKCPSAKKAVKSRLFDFTAVNFRRMEKAFSGFERLISVAVSPWVQKRAEMSPIFKDKENTTVVNGIDCDVFKISGDAEKLKNELGIDKDKKVIVHVTASFTAEIKGGKYIRELAERLGSDAVIVVVGNREEPKNLPDNIIAVGRVENQKKLAEYYSMADLCVIASRRETFAMAVAESMCSGTPIVGFRAGGPESIAIEDYSDFVEYGNIDALYEKVKEFLNKDFDSEEISKKATDKYSKNVMAESYIKLYNEVLK